MNRFWEKVNKAPGLGPNGDCWEWRAWKGHGYGYFWYEGKDERAHRFAWYLEYGRWPIPQANHHCDNRACVRPSHLYEGTQRSNIDDMVVKERQAKGEIVGGAMLTEELVRNDVLPSLKNREPIKSIARRLGVSYHAIHDIKTRRTWKHVA